MPGGLYKHTITSVIRKEEGAVIYIRGEGKGMGQRGLGEEVNLHLTYSG